MSEFAPTGWRAGEVVVRWDDDASDRIEATVAGAWPVPDLDRLARIVREAGRQAWVDLPVVLRGDELGFAEWEAIEARGAGPVVVQAMDRPADPVLPAIGDAALVRIWDAPWTPPPAGFVVVPEWAAARLGIEARRMAAAGATVGLAPTGETATSRIVECLRPAGDDRFAVTCERAAGVTHQLVAKVPAPPPGRVTPPRSVRLAAALRLCWPDRRRRE